ALTFDAVLTRRRLTRRRRCCLRSVASDYSSLYSADLVVNVQLGHRKRRKHRQHEQSYQDLCSIVALRERIWCHIAASNAPRFVSRADSACSSTCSDDVCSMRTSESFSPTTANNDSAAQPFRSHRSVPSRHPSRISIFDITSASIADAQTAV